MPTPEDSDVLRDPKQVVKQARVARARIKPTRGRASTHCIAISPQQGGKKFTLQTLPPCGRTRDSCYGRSKIAANIGGFRSALGMRSRPEALDGVYAACRIPVSRTIGIQVSRCSA
jgi:hypothetical protein